MTGARAVVGIDPGLTGAIAVLEVGSSQVRLLDTPTLTVAKGGSKRTEYDVAGMAVLLRQVAREHDVALVALERIQPMPAGRKRGQERTAGAGKGGGWGAVANFSLGVGYGLWWGFVVAAGLPLERVPPQTWKAAMMHGGRDKGASRQLACELFPSTVDRLARVKDHGRAEALLLAEYVRRRLNPDRWPAPVS